MSELLAHIIKCKKEGKKLLAVLIDPDKTELLSKLLEAAHQNPPAVFLVGGSQNGTKHPKALVEHLRAEFHVPVFLFPGHHSQLTSTADGILLLSLISGRNAELLIGQHVAASMELKKCGIEIIPTGYILIDGGKKSATSIVTGTAPIAANDIELVMRTALAGEQLGMKLIYLEAGSGAASPVPPEMIRSTVAELNIPVFVGGGLRSADQIRERWNAGADVVVVGNILEDDPSLLLSFVVAPPSLPI